MELVLIVCAVLACAIAGVAVAAGAARARRPPLRLDSELDERDEALVLAEVGPSHSPIDRSAQVIDAEPAAPRLAGPADPRRPGDAQP